jgi:hypothetical protein
MLEYRGSTKSLPQIGRDLKVKTLLEGTVLRSGDNVRISGGRKALTGVAATGLKPGKTACAISTG